MKYKIAVLVSDWNYEVVNHFFKGIGKFTAAHPDCHVHVFDDFGIYGNVASTRKNVRGGMEIFNLADLDTYDGIMIEGDQGWPKEVREKVVRAAREKNIPVASLNYPLDGFTYVGTNNYGAIREITEHLIKIHHVQSFAFVKGHEKSQEAVERRHAFEDVCREAHIPENNIRMYGGTWLMESGVDAAKQMLAEQEKGTPLPEAVVCCNDDLAVGVAGTLRAHGVRIPEDVKITGFDNLDVARFYNPRITSVARDYENIAVSGMQYILDVAEGRQKVLEKVYSPHEVLFTASCGCPDIPVRLAEVEEKHLHMSRHLRLLYSLQNTMEQEMMDAGTLLQIMEVFEKYAHAFGTRGMYLVLNPNYLERSRRDADPTQYAEKLKLMGVYNRDGVSMQANSSHVYAEFPGKKLLPSSLIEGRPVMIFYPLHQDMDNIGYIALDGFSPTSEFNILEVMLMIVSNAIASVFNFEYTRKMNEKLEELSVHDTLTGLYNRLGFKIYGLPFCEERREAGKGVHYYFIDLDDMKLINDSYDHDMGDKALQLVAEAVETVSKRYNGFCMRYGGDEFLIITDAVQIEMEDELMAELRAEEVACEFPCMLSVSVGTFCSENFNPISIDACISHADDCMYLRKKLKKNAGAIGNGYDTVDTLTGLHTMREFRRQSASILKRIDGLGQKASILYFNIENFRNYNNQRGFEEGDRLLKFVAQTLIEAFPERLVSRFDGDHFVVMTYDYEIPEGLAHMKKRLLPVEKENAIVMKAGLCHLKAEDRDCIKACDRAKIACDSIRKDYGRKIRWFDDELAQETKMQEYIISHLDESIQKGCIEVYFQTIADCQTRKPCASEALARWKSPAYGLLPPASFIQVLEEYHLIYKLDLNMIEQICQTHNRVWKSGLPLIPVSCNLSGFDFSSCNIFAEIEKIVGKYRIPRKSLHIEVTESTIISDPAFMHKELQKFHDAGYEIWMDDFGSGYSSFNVLKDFDFDVVKLDMGFLSNLNEKSKKIIASVINMAKSIGMRTLAEGVETEEQFKFLREAGCDMAQGYLFSRPHSFSMDGWQRMCGNEL